MEYRLDLNTLLLMLERSTGSLYAEIQHIPGTKGRCQIFVRLERGVIKSCSLTNERGSEMASGEAATKLIQNQVLEWQYTESLDRSTSFQETSHTLSQQLPAYRPAVPMLPPPVRQPLVPVPRSPIPRRTYPVPQHEFMLWSRLYRSVYSLIDGIVSVDYIVHLLAREQGTERVREVLLHLQQSGLITLD